MKSILTIICFLLISSAYSQINPIIDTAILINLQSPIHISHAGDGTNRLFVAEKISGRIKVFDSTFTLIDTLVQVTGMLTSGEQGLLSVAFHPDFYNNRLFYVHYVNTAGHIQIDRYTMSTSDPDEANVSTRVTVDTIHHPGQTNHNGGEIIFGADGMLYISTGDGGGSNDPGNKSQNNGYRLGKMLRIQPNTSLTPPYFTVPTNPLGGQLQAKGLRNPFRWSFDRYTGDMFIGDVGQGAREEVNFLSASAINAGANYGWKCREGNIAGPGACNGSFVDPIYIYPIIGTSRSIIGGHVYRGYKYPALSGYYFCVDYFNDSLRYLNQNGGTWNLTRKKIINLTSIADIGETETGEILLVSNLSSTNGRVLRLKNTGTEVDVYTFIGSGNWSDANNWNRRRKPPTILPIGSKIVIKPRYNGQCTLDLPQTINEGQDLIVEPSKTFNVNANLVIKD
jgi:glucose/arabinose dehydrogenase